MSDISTTTTEGQPQGNMFTRRYGPLPGWGWLVITFALVFLYMKWKSGKTQKTGTTIGTGTSTGSSNALTSNLVGVQEPVPTLAGTYQVSVQPAQDIYTNTSNSSTQGISGSGQNVPASNLQPAGTPAPSPAVNVQ